jgi:hypothetical protein
MTPVLITAARRRQLDLQRDAARRAVGAARLAGDPAAEATAHAELHTAKLALGEHEHSWWQDAV